MKQHPDILQGQGFIIDDTCYPWFAYKGPRFQATEYHWCYTDLESKLIRANVYQIRLHGGTKHYDFTTFRSDTVYMSREHAEKHAEAFKKACIDDERIHPDSPITIDYIPLQVKYQ